jgi:hypothetical protein
LSPGLRGEEMWRIWLFGVQLLGFCSRIQVQLKKQNTVEENNGYVVFKLNMQRSSGKLGGVGGRGGGARGYSAGRTLSYFRLLKRYLIKDDVIDFPSVSDI